MSERHDPLTTSTAETRETINLAESSTIRRVGRYTAVIGSGAAVLLGNAETAQAKRGYAPERKPSVFDIYDMQKQQALVLRPDTIFDEPLDRDVNTKNRVSSCYSGQETFKQASIDIKNDRRTVEVLLTTASQSRYNRLNEYGSWQKGSPEWHVPAQCDDAAKLDATIELDLQKYTKNPRMRTYPRKMLGRLARKRVPRHDVYVDPSQPMLNVQPKRYTFTDKIILKSQKKITDRQLKNNQIYIGLYTQRAQRGRIDPDWPSVTSEMKYLRPITTVKKTKRYYSVGDTWWVGRVPARKDILKSVDQPPKPKRK